MDKTGQTELNFYNTVNMTGESLKDGLISAKNQGIRILQIMKEFEKPMTPFDVKAIYNKRFKHVPITSIRRAMTDLTKCNLLEKTEKQRIEKYGKPNYKWKVI